MPDDNSELRLDVLFQPLLWMEAETVLARLLGREPTADNVLDFLRGPFARTTLSELQSRYHEVTKYDRGLFALPDHSTVRTSILLPLHNAKAAFVLGHFTSCIALGGMLAEMLAIFRFEIAPRELTRAIDLTDAEFTRLGQEERVEVLRKLSLIDARAEALFVGVRGRRRRYMHFLRSENRQAKGDAKSVYRAIVTLTRLIFGVALIGPRTTFHPDVLRMLKRERGL